MCACDEELGRRFLPHQLDYGAELGTQRRVRVTLGFQRNVCNSCKGLPESPAPRAPQHGRTSKILRYYWREITMQTTRRFGDWLAARGEDDWLRGRAKYKDVHEAIGQQVTAEIKELHARAPKYVYDDESQSEVLRETGVQVVRLEGTYARTGGERASLVIGSSTCSVEQFTSRHFEMLGYKVLLAESVPFHVLFGVYMWMLIQDPGDPRNRVCGFGDRSAAEARTNSEAVWTVLPDDFGTPGYAMRRKASIESHFDFLPVEKSELLWTFDYWLEPSTNLRRCLWAHRPDDVDRAREIVTILPAEAIRRILRYLVGDYWQRYCGWPDLLVHREEEFFFVEVKSSKDKLSEDQKRWIRGNHAELGLPFKLVKIHKTAVRPESNHAGKSLGAAS